MFKPAHRQLELCCRLRRWGCYPHTSALGSSFYTLCSMRSHPCTPILSVLWSMMPPFTFVKSLRAHSCAIPLVDIVKAAECTGSLGLLRNGDAVPAVRKDVPVSCAISTPDVRCSTYNAQDHSGVPWYDGRTAVRNCSCATYASYH